MNYNLYPLLFGCALSLSACDIFSSGGNFVPKPIDPTVGGEAFVKKRDAHNLARNHRDDVIMINPSGKKGGKGYYFTNEFIDTMKKQKGSKGLNFYLSQDNNKEMNLIVVSVDANGKDLTGVYKDDKNIDAQYIIGRTTMKCPDNCDVSSWLYNSENVPEKFPDE